MGRRCGGHGVNTVNDGVVFGLVFGEVQGCHSFLSVGGVCLRIEAFRQA